MLNWKPTQKSYPSTDDGHGWVQGDPPSVIRNGWYGWPKPPIRHPSSVTDGFVYFFVFSWYKPIRTDGLDTYTIRTGWYKCLGNPPIRQP